jgi:hypothetical protein
MKRLLLLTAMLALALPVTAKASLIEADPFFVDLHAEGFGDAHRLLTLQTTPLEIGGTSAGAGGTTILSGDAISGADKSAVSSTTALGWSSGANVGIGLNTDTTGSTQGLSVNAINLQVFSSTGTLVDTFSLASPFTLTQAQIKEQQGNGTAVFNFVLNTAEQIEFNADLLANGGLLFVGLNASLGCASGAATCAANDGPDSFLAFNQATVNPVPLPPTMQMFLGGLLLFGGFLYLRSRKNGSVDMIGAAA